MVYLANTALHVGEVPQIDNWSLFYGATVPQTFVNLRYLQLLIIFEVELEAVELADVDRAA